MKKNKAPVPFTDEELKEAVIAVCQAKLSALPEPEDCPEPPCSPDFDERIRRMVAREKRRRSVRTALRRVACFFLALLVGAGAWLALDAEARSAFTAWVRKVSGHSVIYHFYAAPASEELPLYRLGWVPEGLEESRVVEDATDKSFVYTEAGNEKKGFIFSYCIFPEGTYGHFEIQGKPSDYEWQEVYVNGLRGDYYQTLKPNDTNNLVWADEETGILFDINGYLDKEDMLHIAESVYLAE